MAVAWKSNEAKCVSDSPDLLVFGIQKVFLQVLWFCFFECSKVFLQAFLHVFLMPWFVLKYFSAVSCQFILILMFLGLQVRLFRVSFTSVSVMLFYNLKDLASWVLLVIKCLGF